MPNISILPLDADEKTKAMYTFDIFDVDKNGLIDQKEFTQLINYPELQSCSHDKLTCDQIKTALDRIAVSNDGKITKEQFYQWYSGGGIGNGRNDWDEPSQLQIIKRNIKSTSFFDNLLRLGMRPTYYCHMCLEYQPILDDKNNTQLVNCGHRYCTVCLSEYLQNSINNGQVRPLCFNLLPNNKPCNSPMTENEILKLIPEKSQKKYYKFKANKENENNRQCPKCDHTQLGTPDVPSMTCDNCGAEYCFSHGDAHQDSDCATYDRKHRQEEKRSCAIIAKRCKPCPECKGRINKNGGCNHMKCPNCGCSFCWLCMKVIEDKPLPDHYKLQPGNIANPCVGRQMEGMNNQMRGLAGNLTGGRRVCWLSFIGLFLFLTTVVTFPISAICTLVFSLLCICCIVCVVRLRTERTWYEELWRLLKIFFFFFSVIVCGLLSCVLCVPCLLFCMLIGGCIPSAEDENDDEDRWGDDDVDQAVKDFELADQAVTDDQKPTDLISIELNKIEPNQADDLVTKELIQAEHSSSEVRYRTDQEDEKRNMGDQFLV